MKSIEEIRDVVERVGSVWARDGRASELTPIYSALNELEQLRAENEKLKGRLDEVTANRDELFELTQGGTHSESLLQHQITELRAENLRLRSELDQERGRVRGMTEGAERLKAELDTAEEKLKSEQYAHSYTRHQRNLSDEGAKKAEAMRMRVVTENIALAETLAKAEASKNDAYSQRNRCVALIARMALRLGWRAGVGRHVGENWEDDWRSIVFVDLPAGQISWHFHDSESALLEGLPKYESGWDGHSDDEKWRRVAALSAQPKETKPAEVCDAPGEEGLSCTRERGHPGAVDGQEHMHFDGKRRYAWPDALKYAAVTFTREQVEQAIRLADDSGAVGDGDHPSEVWLRMFRFTLFGDSPNGGEG